MNQIINSIPKLKEILFITNTNNFHDFFINTSIKNLFNNNPKIVYDSVLALGANHVEAESLIKFPFKKIVLSGITSPDEKTKEIIKKDKRVSYTKQNMENISLKSQSFDLVFVKEAIHHVPRPVLVLYECLRVSKKAVIFIEPQETCLGNFLDFLNLISRYETNQTGNQKFRDNFVYRWRKKEIIKILNSYYLESGYNVNFTSCWMSNRFNGKFPFLVKSFNFLGWTLSNLPGASGNYLICTIKPGKNLPI
jgi:SAM-dependent methyltransferase